MTKWTEAPLRPPAQPWPGLNTKGGRIDPGLGQMQDCTNVVINRSDILEKRKGMVRAFDEQFSGVVCGLFKYTDTCGIERIVVADETAISIRQPFAVPVFQQADCFPGDSFSLADGSPLDPTLWNNAARYEVQTDRMVLATGAADLPSLDSSLPFSRSAEWFKDACSASYRVRAQFTFDPAVAEEQEVIIAIRASDDGLNYIIGRLSSFQTFNLTQRSAGVDKLLAQGVWTGPGLGFFTVKYDQENRVAGIELSITGGTILDLFSTTQLTTLQDADMGLKSRLGLQTSGVPTNSQSILVVDGGNL
jgi:hypothetical protein